ncbi:hypothetical protein BGX23_009620 [Mortierella sp. AD031]|nr:hypothetical protein BGX23_009620 [Mortierella sp. AD031]
MDPSTEGHYGRSNPYTSGVTTTPTGAQHPYPSHSPTYSQSSTSSPTGLNAHSGMEKTEVDMEKSEPIPVEQMANVEEPDGLKRELKLRHMVMIAISGTIGTGLFLTSGKTIATAGPLGALLAYVIIGIWLVFVCQAIGEIATLLPLPGAELSASSLVISFWLPEGSSFPVWVVPCIIIVLLVSINFLGVKMYGEAEYWFSILKVVTIIVFIITGILTDAGAVGGKTFGVDYWHIDGAPFKGGFRAFLSVLVSVGFAYGGTELSGITAAESSNPHKHVPKAVNTVLIRIAFFYILSIFFLSCIVPNDDPRLMNTSGTVVNAPFTIVFLQAGMKGGADYMNAVIFTSIVSATNSDFYVATRMLLSLSKDGWAPKWSARLTVEECPTLRS